MIRALAALVARVPWRTLGALGIALGWLAGSVLRIRRSAVRAAMARIGAPPSEASAMYRALGRGALELLWLGGASPDERGEAIETSVALDGHAQESLADALARGPVVLAATHTGNWELAAYAAARILARGGRELAVVAKPISMRSFHAFTTGLRESAGLVLLSPRGALAASRRALAAGNVVAMPIDQVPDARRHGLRASFLGQEAHCDRGPATLAARAGATILVVATSLEPGGARYRVRVLDVIPPGRGQAWIGEATRRATAALDAFVRERPSSWLWLHRRWREPTTPQARPLRLVASPHPG